MHREEEEHSRPEKHDIVKIYTIFTQQSVTNSIQVPVDCKPVTLECNAAADLTGGTGLQPGGWGPLILAFCPRRPS